MLNAAGEKVRRAGAYNVMHRGHRPSHQAILLEGESFPDCCVCGDAVSFEFAHSLLESDLLEHIGYDHDFIDSVLGCRRRNPRSFFSSWSWRQKLTN
jgi:hypothetical protein